MNRQSIIDQLKEDEGFRARAYWDKKQFTYGYGTRAPCANATISEPAACALLETRVDEAIADFNRIFQKHLTKFNDVRTECFVNLIFNMGPGRPGGNEGLLSFKNTLGFIFNNKDVPWNKVAEGLKNSLWFRQVKDSGDDDGPGPDQGRGERIVAEVFSGIKTKG
jgi:GH24 family phage-related lysozyme (muramidase)